MSLHKSDIQILVPVLDLPREKARMMPYLAFCVNNTPILLFGHPDDPESTRKNKALVQNSAFLRALVMLGYKGKFCTATVDGCDLMWSGSTSLITLPRHETKTKDILGIVLNDPHMVIATICCISESIAKAFRPVIESEFQFMDKLITLDNANPGLSIIQ